MTAGKQHAHALLDRLPPDRMTAAVRFLEFLLLAPPPQGNDLPSIEDEEISEEEEEAVARSKEWFKHNAGIPFEEVVAGLGFTMDQLRNHRTEEERDPVC